MDGAMNRVIVLGAGRVGAAMARDLARDADLSVSAADARPDALRTLRERAAEDGAAIRTLPLDLADPRSLARALDGHDLAIGAVPGPMGFETVRRVLQAGLDIVDISFFEEDALELEALARKRGRTAIVDAGVAPGLSNVVLGHYEAALEEVTRFECLVGGVPAHPAPPWQYKAPFSPIDVLAEYTRPARIRRGGEDLTLPALSEVEIVEFPGVGTFEAFNTDGLRTLLRTSRAPDLVEKTMRWPGHADRMRAMRDSGFFEEGEVELPSGARVVPLELSARLLFDAWRYEEGEEDLTVMRITVEGRDAHGSVRHVVQLVDRRDPVTGVSSMARTTGYTATALARLVIEGRYREPGLSPPEVVGAEPGVLETVIDHLAARGIAVDRAEARREG
jgi:lysine 6-dehydrogenase